LNALGLTQTVNPAEEVGSVIPFVLVPLGLVLLAAGLVQFFYPKPPPLDFEAFLGAHARLYVSLICIVFGGALMLLGLWAR
jgi:hypothetical protein